MTTHTDDRPVTVLVVEDEQDQRQLLTVYLNRAGCTVIAAGDAEAGLARIEGVELDLAVIDLLLPGMSGWSLAEALQQRHPQVPIVVTSVLDTRSPTRLRTPRCPNHSPTHSYGRSCAL